MKKSIAKVNGKKDIGAMIISILIAEAVGILSGLIAGNTREIFNNLQKPSFSPEGYVFPVVWGILYLLMGIAAYRIWMIGKEGKDVKKPLTLYAIQLGLNFLWSIIFFRFGLIKVAFFELLILLIFIVLTTLEFYRHDKIAGILMIPYLLWTIFAAILNCFIIILN